MSDEYTPTTEEVRLEYMAVRWGKNDTVSFEARAEFDRWLAEVERAAAARAWDEGLTAGLREANDLARGVVNNPALNPYRRARAEAYRQERGEQ